MNFILFLVVLVLFYLYYWGGLVLIISLPCIPIATFIIYLTEQNKNKLARIALVPTCVIGFIIGTIWPCGIFGMGIGLIA